MEAIDKIFANLAKATEASFERLLTSKGVANQADRDAIYWDAMATVSEKARIGAVPLELADLKHYLHGVVEKKLLEHYRQRQQAMQLVSLDEQGCSEELDEPSALLAEVNEEVTFCDEMDRDRVWSEQVVRKAIGLLTGKARNVWSDVMDGWSMQEIADRHGLANANSAKSLKLNSRDKLKALVKEVMKKGVCQTDDTLPSFSMAA